MGGGGQRGCSLTILPRIGMEQHHVRKLEQTIRSCGVSFQIWQNKEPTGKPIAGSFDWTALSGKHKLKVLKSLPAKMDTLFDESLAPSVAKLWNVSVIVNFANVNGIVGFVCRGFS